MDEKNARRWCASEGEHKAFAAQRAKLNAIGFAWVMLAVGVVKHSWASRNWYMERNAKCLATSFFGDQLTSSSPQTQVSVCVYCCKVIWLSAENHERNTLNDSHTASSSSQSIPHKLTLSLWSWTVFCGLLMVSSASRMTSIPAALWWFCYYVLIESTVGVA